jgi:hypothetical protein
MLKLMNTEDQGVTKSTTFSLKKNAFWVLAIIIVAILSGLKGYKIGLNVRTKETYIQAKKTTVPVVTRLPTQSIGIGGLPLNPAVTLSPSTDTPGWKKFSDAEGFSLDYPADWQIDAESSLEDNPNNDITSLTFTTPSENSNPQTLVAQITTDRTELGPPVTLNQLVQSQQQDQYVSGKPNNLIIDGYPAVEFTNTYYNYVDIYTIAPGRGLKKAEYEFLLGNPPPENYESSPYVQQQVKNFMKVVFSTKFPQK